MIRPTLIYRRLFCRKGHGVHSPFVYDLITKVIEERRAYYSYYDIGLMRLRLLQNNLFIHYRGNQVTVKKAVRKYCISKKEGELLFRLVNHYKSHTILSIGSSMGLAPLYLTKHDSNVSCITLENEPDFAAIAKSFLQKNTNSPIQIYSGIYQKQLSEALKRIKQIDCLYISKDVEVNNIDGVFNQCLPFMHDETICIIAGIRTLPAKLRYWRELCKHPRVTVSIDLFKMGLLFFHPKLYRRTYKTTVI